MGETKMGKYRQTGLRKEQQRRLALGTVHNRKRIPKVVNSTTKTFPN